MRFHYERTIPLHKDTACPGCVEQETDCRVAEDVKSGVSSVYDGSADSAAFQREQGHSF